MFRNHLLTLTCVFAGCLTVLPTDIRAEDAQPMSSFRYINSSSPAAPSGHSVVWLDGTIAESSTEQGTGPSGQSNAPLFAEQLVSEVEPIPTHSSYDTTRLTAYDQQADGLNEIIDSIDAQSHPHPPESNCVDSLNCGPKPWLAWKQTSSSITWLPKGSTDLGLFDIEISGTIGSPRLPFLAITPNYQATFLDAPAGTDLPDTLHRGSVAFMGMLPLSERFIGQVIVAPGMSTDLENTGSDAIRTTGIGMVIFMQSPELQWMFGVVYLDREDISLLPAVGLNWTPNERTKFEFTFPRPRFKRRISDRGLQERWWYLAAEFGGGSWAIERSTGVDDVVTLSDYRLLTGVETLIDDERSWFWEAGLVLGREVEYESDIGNFDQDPTLLLRCGVNF